MKLFQDDPRVTAVFHNPKGILVEKRFFRGKPVRDGVVGTLWLRAAVSFRLVPTFCLPKHVLLHVSHIGWGLPAGSWHFFICFLFIFPSCVFSFHLFLFFMFASVFLH